MNKAKIGEVIGWIFVALMALYIGHTTVGFVGWSMYIIIEDPLIIVIYFAVYMILTMISNKLTNKNNKDENLPTSDNTDNG